MIPGSLIIGHHGCEAALVQQVVNGRRKLAPSHNGYDWLGEGIYFWAHDPLRALEWASDTQFRQLDAPAVLSAVIELGNCLNLAERSAVAQVARGHEFLKDTLRSPASATPMPLNRGGRRELDNRVMETLHQLREPEGLPPYDTVIGYFAEGRPIYEGAELRHQNHLQICERHPACILGCFLQSTFAGV
jgi:hypothetical protein